MTERALPLGTHAPPRPEVAPALAPPSVAATLAAARAVPRTAATTRRPVHVAVTLGVTASLYAVSLAGVTALQHDSDARLTADRAPASGAVDALRRANDAVDVDLAGLTSGYSAASAEYGAVADRIGAHESDLVALGTQVSAAEGAAAALHVPTISLRAPLVSGAPSVSRTPTAAGAPTVSRLPALTPATVEAAPKPVSNACTTASGKPC